VLLLRRIFGKTNSPAVLAQCVWLFDLWRTFPAWKRHLYRALLSKAELVTTQSPENMRFANRVLRRDDCHAVKFGVGSGIKQLPFKGKLQRPTRILSLGNDMHRDWETLIAAFGDRADYSLRLASKSVPRNLLQNCKNVQSNEVKTAQELTDLYRWAHLVVVPLKENLHASGITVLLEATLFGLPVVCTDTGGLRSYFSDDEICFVPVGDPRAMREATDFLVADDDSRNLRTMKAQATLIRTNLTAQGFADQHRRLSEMILFSTPAVVAKRDLAIANGSAACAAEEQYAQAPGSRR
jgi:glycosyltransferase involved in cell wall biosynthesis